MIQDDLGRRTFCDQYNASPELIARLDQYVALLRRWTPAINLVSKSTLDDVWRRHFLDSATLFTLCRESDLTWLDLGSGGGFPGMVIAIMASDRRPHLSVTCVESDQRKATFLRSVSRETSTAVDIISQRIESLTPMAADVISARALAPLDKLLFLAYPHLNPGGICLFPKGKTYRAEIDNALESWRFTAETVPSQTDEQTAIIKIGDLERA